MDSVDPDVVLKHILPSLDGPSLASVSCTSANLRHLISTNSYNLWSHVCNATLPSLDTPRMRYVISTFPPDGDGPRSFFSQSYAPQQLLSNHLPHNFHHRGVTEFISAVDIRYKGNVVFSKMVETAATETETEWFRSSPFRVDLVDQKEVVNIKSTLVKHPMNEDECGKLIHDMTLSWILIDPVNHQATNLSNGQPVNVQRHWLSGEAIVEFCSIIDSSSRKKGEEEMVKCGIRVILGGSECGEMQVREVSLVMEDMDGKHLNGEGSLVILGPALNGSNKWRRTRYEEFLERKKEKKERKVRREKRLDMLCVGFGVTLLSSCFMFLAIRLFTYCL